MRWLGPPLPELSRERAVNGLIGWSRIPNARLWDNRGGVVAVVLSPTYTVFMAGCRPVAPVDINYNGERRQEIDVQSWPRGGGAGKVNSRRGASVGNAHRVGVITER